MNLVKSILLILTIPLIGCGKLPGQPGSRYSLEGYNNAGYVGDYQRGGGFEDVSLEEARKERERKAREAEAKRDLEN